ncbi:MAG: hypothetical protein JSR91_19400 [Proteobacteria bacterium]|nr:hypothetical protein [Pseudomonadota bacterium]
MLKAFRPPSGEASPPRRVMRKAGAVAPCHDSIIAKGIARGLTRDAALDRPLESFVVEGVKTNTPFVLAVLSDESIRVGCISTSPAARVLARADKHVRDRTRAPAHNGNPYR